MIIAMKRIGHDLECNTSYCFEERLAEAVFQFCRWIGFQNQKALLTSLSIQSKVHSDSRYIDLDWMLHSVLGRSKQSKKLNSFPFVRPDQDGRSRSAYHAELRSVHL